MKTKLLYRVITGLFLIVVFGSITPVHAVIIDGRDWRQVTDTLEFTWNELSTIYDTGTGVLNQSNTELANHLGVTIDFAGYKWASRMEVMDLFNHYLPEEDRMVVPGFHQGQAGDFAQAMFQDFNLTYNIHSKYVSGTTRDKNETAANKAWVGYIQEFPLSFNWERADLTLHTGLDDVSPFRGIWLYRDASPVPEPATFILFGMGLLSLTGISRKKL